MDISEPAHCKTYNKTCATSENSDQPAHLRSLMRVFAARMKKAWVLSYPLSAQQRLWSNWADAQADLSLHWANIRFVGFITRWLINIYTILHNFNTVQNVHHREFIFSVCRGHWALFKFFFKYVEGHWWDLILNMPKLTTCSLARKNFDTASFNASFAFYVYLHYSWCKLPCGDRKTSLLASL